jgi:hypothetical protein
LTQIRERSTQTISNFIDRQLTPTKYLIDTEETRTPWNKCTTVRSPYIRGKLSYKTEFKEGSVSFSESFDPDDPTLIDRFPDYTTETDLASMLLVCGGLVRRCVARFVYFRLLWKYCRLSVFQHMFYCHQRLRSFSPSTGWWVEHFFSWRTSPPQTNNIDANKGAIDPDNK